MEYKCAVCGAVFTGGMFEDPCPRCQWIPVGNEDEIDENEYVRINYTTIKRAKENYAKGLTIFGDPIKL